MNYTFNHNFIMLNPIDKKHFSMEETIKHVIKIIYVDKSLSDIISEFENNKSSHYYIDANGLITQFFNTKYWSHNNNVSDCNKGVISIIIYSSDSIHDSANNNSLERLIRILKSKYDIQYII